MGGNYSGTLEQRLASTDTLVHLDYPTSLCLWRGIRRTLEGWGQNRSDQLAPGCPERFDWPFFKFVISYRKLQRERDLARMVNFAGRVLRFTSPADLSAFVTVLKRSAQQT